MRILFKAARSMGRRMLHHVFAASALLLLSATALLAHPAEEAGGGEASLKLPDLSSVKFLGVDGHTLLLFGILICIFGLLFGMTIFMKLKNLPVHSAMREISELIYETCKTYLFTQGKFLLLLWVFIAIVIVLYFGILSPVPGKSIAVTLPIILLFSLIGMGGSYSVAWFGIRVNTFANSRTAFAGLRGKPYPINHIPLESGMSIGMMLISVELLMMLIILLFIPARLRRAVLHRIRHRRIAGRRGVAYRGRHLHQDRRHRLRPDEDRLQDQGRRRAQPRRHRGLHRRQRGRFGWPHRRRLRNLRRDGRRPDHLHPSGGERSHGPGQLLVWIFVMRVIMLIASAAAYFINGAIQKAALRQRRRK